MVGLTIISQGKPGDPVLFPALNHNLSMGIGNIVCYWACLEAVVTEMAKTLLIHNKDSRQLPREFSRKLDLLNEQFKTAFTKEKELIEYFKKKIISPIKEAKRIRDLLNHGQILGWSTDNGPCIRFITKEFGRKSKRYFYQADFDRISGDIAKCAGRLNQLAEAPEDIPISPESKIALARVLDKDRWRKATDRVLELRRHP